MVVRNSLNLKPVNIYLQMHEFSELADKSIAVALSAMTFVLKFIISSKQKKKQVNLHCLLFY